MNESKMIQVLARVEDEREAFAKGATGAVGFNMASWYDPDGWQDLPAGREVCGTTACLAGHAVLMEGYRINASTLTVETGTGTVEMVSRAACRILGLNRLTEGNPFNLGTLDQVYRWVADRMGVDEQVLRDKVQAERKSSDRASVD